MKQGKKRVIEWLNLLRNPYKKKAVANCRKERAAQYASSLTDALELAFIWSNSPEGYSYWNDFWNKLVDKENFAK